MAGVCDSLIQKGIELNCESPIVKGVEPDGLIMNRSDIDFAKSVFDTTNKNILTTLILKSGNYETFQDKNKVLLIFMNLPEPIQMVMNLLLK